MRKAASILKSGPRSQSSGSLALTYGVNALDSVSLEAPAGRMVGLIGPVALEIEPRPSSPAPEKFKGRGDRLREDKLMPSRRQVDSHRLYASGLGRTFIDPLIREHQSVGSSAMVARQERRIAMLLEATGLSPSRIGRPSSRVE